MPIGHPLNIEKDELYDSYINKNMSIFKIAKLYNCHFSTIGKQLKKLGIPKNKNIIKLTWAKFKETPQYQIWRDKQSKIHKLIVTPKQKVNLIHFKKGQKMPEEWIHRKYNISKQELADLYIYKRMTSSQIAKIIGCSKSNILRLLVKFDIPRFPENKKLYQFKKGAIVPDYVRAIVSANNRKLWQTKEYREKVIRNSLKALRKRPTSIEKEMIEIIQRHNLPYKYTGDGSFILGRKNPDFVNVNGEKIIIEVANSFHHPKDYEQKRRDYFANYGWKTLVFNANNYNKFILSEDEIVNKIKGGG